MKLFTNEILALRLHIPPEKCDIKNPLPLWQPRTFTEILLSKILQWIYSALQ